jgi:hypothetical protein
MTPLTRPPSAPRCDAVESAWIRARWPPSLVPAKLKDRLSVCVHRDELLVCCERVRLHSRVIREKKKNRLYSKELGIL